MSLTLRYYGDPVLRQQAEPIEEITDEIRSIAKELIATMRKHDGIGLAATQVGVMLRMFATNVYPDMPDGEPNYGEPYVILNPVISQPSDELTEMNEGCLSIPGMYAGPVPRPFSIAFEGMDLDGNPIRETIQGFQARHRMHEVDHLNGVLYIDRIKGKRRRMIEADLRKIKSKYS